MRRFVVILFTLFYILTSSGFVFGETEGTGSQKNEKLINRKVLILDFANLRKSDDYAYLETSLADSLQDPLDRTKSFELLSRSIWQNFIHDGKFKKDEAYKEDVAIQAGKTAGADVVVIGGFVAIGDKLQVFVKAIELSSGRAMVSRNAIIKIDNNMFESINKLAVEISNLMKEKLPPLPQRVITVERRKYITVTKEVEKKPNYTNLKLPESVTYGGEIWRTLVIPGWGHTYAGQWRGWIYIPFWGLSAGSLIMSVIFANISYDAYSASYKAGNSDSQSLYNTYKTWATLRQVSSWALLAAYLIPVVDILITGNRYVLNPKLSMVSFEWQIQPENRRKDHRDDFNYNETGLKISVAAHRRF